MTDITTINLCLPGVIDCCIHLSYSLDTTLTTLHNSHPHSRMDQLKLDLTTSSFYHILYYFRDSPQSLPPGFAIHLFTARVFLEGMEKTVTRVSNSVHEPPGGSESGGWVKSILNRLRYARDAREIERVCKDLDKWRQSFVMSAQVYMDVFKSWGYAPMGQGQSTVDPPSV